MSRAEVRAARNFLVRAQHGYPELGLGMGDELAESLGGGLASS